jgi:HAD superfamily hydrolase (TIGR01509 family)
MLRPSKRAVLFDLDGTLRHYDPPQIETFFDYARELGLQITPQQAYTTTRWIYAYWADSDDLKEDRERSRDDWEALWLCFAERQLASLGVPAGDTPATARAIQQRMVDDYRPSDIIPEQVHGLLGGLRQAGCRLAVVSNRRQPITDLVTEIGLAEHFDLVLAAGEVGWWKPDHRLLTYAANQLGVRPQDALYVGDNYYADVPAAEGAGMDVVLLDPQSLFPEAACPVIRDLGELSGLLSVAEGG